MKTALVSACILGIMLWNVLVTAQPRASDPRSGQTLYSQHCVRCHGEGLDGRGPDAGSLVVPPANFTSKRLRLKTDFELWLAIKQGVLFTDMHAWRNDFSDDQIQDLIAYIRQRAPHTID